MSLEQKITDATAAVNDLISTFNSKKTDIESAVDDALAALPESTRSFFVDAINGDDTNDGSEINPLKTIPAGINKIPNGGYVYLSLFDDQTHVLDSFNVFTSKSIVIGRRGGGIEKPLIQVRSIASGGFNYYSVLEARNSTVVLVNVDLIDFQTNPGLPDQTGWGIIGRLAFGNNLLRLYNCNVELNHTRLISDGNDGMMMTVRIQNCTLTINSVPPILGTNGLVALSVIASVMDGTVTDYIDNIIYDSNTIPVPRNVISNIAL